MTSPSCAAPIGDEGLVEYWLGELDEAHEARIDEHVLGCMDCSRRLAALVALADGVRSAFRRGVIHAFVTGAFVKDVAGHGAHVREYRVPCDGSVNCSVAPGDELLVARLQAPLGGVHRLDALSYVDDATPAIFPDVPFDAANGEVVVASKIAQIRGMPSHRQRIRLIAVDDKDERVIGDYTFNHSAHEAT